jgi:queuine tRNA-ribosyltransferase
VFGIVQGGLDEELRSASIDALSALDFDGYALGGLSVGESSEDMYRVVRFAAPRLPARKTRYLMGVGYPEDIIEAVAAGVDLFDCVLPTRNARNGNLFTTRGRLIIKHSAWREDPGPVDEDCDCSACARYSRAYMRHLFLTGEMLGRRLYTIHNLFHYQRLMRRIRASIEGGTFHELLAWARTRDGEGRAPSAQRWPEAPPMPVPPGT